MKTRVLLVFLICMLFISAGTLFYLLFSEQFDKSITVESKNISTSTRNKSGRQTTPDLSEPDSSKNTEVNISEPLKIVAVGDILMGRTVKERVEKQKKRYLYPFTKVAGILKKGDIVFGNLEESITASTKSLTGIHQGGKYVLKNEVEAMKGIKYAGFNLLSLANNHILDYYNKGLYDTIKILDKNKVAHAGAGENINEARKLAIIEKKGLKIGLLAYTDMAYVTYKGNPPISFYADKKKAGVAPNIAKNVYEDIKHAKSKVDILIVSFHWGVENSFYKTSAQIKFAHSLINKGADIILGHHPHRYQGIELYKGKPIVYSMGNFLFDQNPPENQEGFILNMELTDKKLTSLELTPARVLNMSLITLPKGGNAKSLLQRELNLCRDSNSDCKIKNNKIVFNFKK